MSDPDYIYLQPECCASEDTGRLWCEDDPDDGEDGAEWVQYVRADLTGVQGIHSCHPKCQRPMCKLRREKEALAKAGTDLYLSLKAYSKDGAYNLQLKAWEEALEKR